MKKLLSVAIFSLAMLVCLPAVAQHGKDAHNHKGAHKEAKGRHNHKEAMTKAIINNIFTRKSVRSYTGGAVTKDTLELLVKAGMAAPTGMNRQPWQFYATNNPKTIEEAAKKLGRGGNMVKEAGAVIVVCGVPAESEIYWAIDATCATENILLAAEALGLGAVWLSAYPNEERMNTVSEAFDIPKEFKVLCYIPVGHPTGKEQPKDKWKPERFHFDKW